MRDIVFGQYVQQKSIIHLMDPRAKLIFLVAYIVLIFCTFNFYALAVPVILAVVMMLLSKVSIGKYLKSLKMIIVVVIITAIFNLFYGGGQVFLKIGPISITEGGINNSIVIVLRILCLLIASETLTFTTTPTDLTDGIERLLKPLKLLHIKVHEIAMMMTIALRFVPTLLEETDKIMLAQKARGADMDSGGIVKRAKALVPIFIPLFVSAIRRAMDLAMAMECRCYHGGEGRTRMKTLRFSRVDVFGFILFSFVTAGIILLDIFLPHIVR